MKTDKLLTLERRKDGTVIARTVCHWEIRFLWYTQKEIIRTLRTEYNCVVPRGVKYSF